MDFPFKETWLNECLWMLKKYKNMITTVFMQLLYCGIKCVVCCFKGGSRHVVIEFQWYLRKTVIGLTMDLRFCFSSLAGRPAEFCSFSLKCHSWGIHLLWLRLYPVFTSITNSVLCDIIVFTCSAPNFPTLEIVIMVPFWAQRWWIGCGIWEMSLFSMHLQFTSYTAPWQCHYSDCRVP